MNKNKTGIPQTITMLLLLITCFIIACDSNPGPSEGRSDQFETAPQKFDITPGLIDEASGLAASVNMDGYLWTHQDSGQPASLYLVSGDGKSIKEFNIPGAVNHDWEDMTKGPGPRDGTNYLYIGDIGNNNPPMTETNIIYRIPEINNITASFEGSQLEKITFKYPDGPRDAETLLLDPVTKDIFVISKESGQTGIYRLAYPQSTTGVMTAEKTGTIPAVNTATSGDIASDGAEILIRTYLTTYYWKRKTGETVAQALSQNALKQHSVVLEPQGEGISFDRQNNGFYSISEKGNAQRVTLNYYKRK
ncbi:PE-PGRS family protein [Dyadobacter psychrotolerans]|uniref:PE-PGRS family protein n=1 Tax=Dyadobacter psychrotolerans TaxID=2541721 RepID=A0A4R5DM43_9BACT|nr:PE-PGRS family protein [Dyadobacter psychrotolerans]TDE13144.1 PE-PGRS family protein [Dyadobacter psychrotolerans]